MLKILHFADLHLDTPFKWAPPDIARQKRQGLRDVLERILTLAKSLQVDAVTSGGDLYEQESFAPDTAIFLRQQFANLQPIPIFLAPGNHDWYGEQSLYHQVDWSSNVHIFRSDRLEAVPLRDGATLWGAAHITPAGTGNLVQGFRVYGEGTLHLALFHGSEIGATHFATEAPHAPFSEANLQSAGFTHALLGHWHQPRSSALYTYPGNPEPLVFGEQGERGVVLLTIDSEGNIQQEHHQVAGSRLHDLNLEVSSCQSTQDLRQLVSDQLQGKTGVARVTLRGELATEIDFSSADLASAAPWMDLVVFRPQFRIAYDLERLAAEPTVRGHFVRSVQAANHLSEAQRQRILVTGLRALAGRKDL